MSWQNNYLKSEKLPLNAEYVKFESSYICDIFTYMTILWILLKVKLRLVNIYSKFSAVLENSLIVDKSLSENDNLVQNVDIYS